MIQYFLIRYRPWGIKFEIPVVITGAGLTPMSPVLPSWCANTGAVFIYCKDSREFIMSSVLMFAVEDVYASVIWAAYSV